MINLVVLMQFLACVPKETARWIQRDHSESFGEAIRMTEAHLAAYVEAGTTPKNILLWRTGALNSGN